MIQAMGTQLFVFAQETEGNKTCFIISQTKYITLPCKQVTLD